VAWHTGRTFYCCPCGGQGESIEADPPPSLPCWHCENGIMAQWVPPAVTAERAAQTALAGPIGTLL
jgi:hypothetical protein